MANAFNRNDLDQLRAENGRLKNAAEEKAKTDDDSTLSDDEVKTKIAQADANPTNINFQKNLGMALYRYALTKQNTDLLADVGRLLNRAHAASASDNEVTVALGNVMFDIAYAKKDNAQFEQAREFYRQALAQKPDDADVRTDYGLTYFLIQPPDYDAAMREFQKALQSDPQNEKTLQMTAQVYLAQKKPMEAEKIVARLKQVNSANQTIGEFETQIAQTKTNAQNQ